MYAWSDRGSNYPYNNVSDVDRLGMRVKYGFNDSPVCAVRIQPGTLQINNTGGPIGMWDKDDAYSDDSFQLQYNISYVGPYTPTYNVTDSDGDGLPDFVETHGFMDLQGNTYNPKPDNTDSDGDGLYDNQEAGTWTTVNGLKFFQIISDPTKVDTDGDGLDDLQESDWGTNAFVKDSDHDGLTDYEEVYGWDETLSSYVLTGPYLISETIPLVPPVVKHVSYGTDPTNSDTDGDGFSDSYETKNTGYWMIDTTNSIVSPNVYYVNMYDPLHAEGGEHPSLDDLFNKGLGSGYDESYSFKNNPFYVEGCIQHQHVEEGVLTGITIAPLLIPGFEYLSAAGAYELEVTASNDLPVIDADLNSDLATASDGGLRNYELSEYAQALRSAGASNDQSLSGILSDICNSGRPGTYDSLIKGGFTNEFLGEQIDQGVNPQTVDDFFTKNNLYDEYSTLPKNLQEQSMENGKISGKVTAYLKKLSINKYANAIYAHLKGFDAESSARDEYDQTSGTWLVDQSHITNNGMDMFRETDNDVFHIEVATGPVDVRDESYLLKDPITRKVTGFNVNYDITDIQDEYEQQGMSPYDARIRAEDIFTSNKNKYLVEYVKSYNSQDIISNLQKAIGQTTTTLHYETRGIRGNVIEGDMTIIYKQYQY